MSGQAFTLKDKRKKGIGYCIYGESQYYELRITYIGGNYEEDLNNKALNLHNVLVTVKTKKGAPVAVDYIYGEFVIDRTEPIFEMVSADKIDPLIEELKNIKEHLVHIKTFFDQFFPVDAIKKE